MSEPPSPLVPREGWHVMHLFYHIDHGQWQILDDNEKREAKTAFTELVQEIRTTPDTQLLTFTVATRSPGRITAWVGRVATVTPSVSFR